MTTRDIQPFEIDTEAILADRQNKSPILESVPTWLIRHICKPESRRGPKIPEYSCGSGYSSSAHGGAWFGGVYQSSRTNLNETPETWAQRNAAIQRAKNRRERRGGKPKVEIPTGNLPEQDYRFWEGCRAGPIVKCRWCGRRCDTKEERINHFRSMESKNCSKLLRIVYENAVAMSPRWCFVCGLTTRSSRWGIPMCNQPSCIMDWKFLWYDKHSEFKRRIDIERHAGHLRIYEGLKSA
jgi:hypothetical protein